MCPRGPVAVCGGIVTINQSTALPSHWGSRRPVSSENQTESSLSHRALPACAVCCDEKEKNAVRACKSTPTVDHAPRDVTQSWLALFFLCLCDDIFNLIRMYDEKEHEHSSSQKKRLSHKYPICLFYSFHIRSIFF